jgi:hypothetical protein
MNSKILAVSLLSLGALGVGLGTGCSSSNKSTPDSGAEEDANGGSSGGSSTSSSSGGGMPEASINLACMGGDCDGGACCANVNITTFSFSSMCAASCNITETTPQFCKAATDCPSGYGCAPNILMMGPNVCTAGASSSSGGGDSGAHEGGTSSSSGGEGGTSSGSEAGASDAPTGG